MSQVARLESPPSFRALTFTDVAGMLAQTIGQEKSAEVVGVAAVALGYRGPLLTREQATNLLDHLARVPGLIGIAARFAQRRAQGGDDAEPPSTVRAVERPPGERTLPSSERDAGVRGELVALLSQSLGVEKAEEEVSGACRRLGLGSRLEAAQAARVLDELARTPGAIGATARFAKARFLLRK
jgi:hypothetical protein